MLRAFFLSSNLLLVLGVLLFVIGCTRNSHSPPNTLPSIGKRLVDARGEVFEFTQTPTRILPLSQTQAAWLYELKAEHRIIARPKGLDEPPGLIYKPSIRLSPLDSARLLDLRPDCILMRNAQMDSFSELIDFCKKHDIPVFVQSFERLLNYTEKVRELGTLVDQEPLADSLTKRYASYFNTIGQRTAKGLRHNAVMVLQYEPLVVVAQDHHLNDLTAIAGGQNPFAYDRLPYAVVSADSILMRNPEFIFLPRGGDGETMNNFMQIDERFQHLQAVKTRRVFAYDPRTYLVPGPNLVHALQEMTSTMHTEADAGLLYMELFSKPIKASNQQESARDARLY